MSEFTPLREAVDALAGRSPSPDFGDLTRQAARRGRRRVAMVAAGAVAVIAVGAGLAAGTLGGNDEPSPIGEPTTPASTLEQETVEPAPRTPEEELDAIVAQVPGWSVVTGRVPGRYDYAFNGPCAGDWGKAAPSGADGGISVFGIGHLGFPSAARTSAAAAEFVDNLASCKKTAWRTHPIPRTGAVLAYSPDAVVWIQQGHNEVHVMQAPTTDGPPPVSVQVAVAEWLTDYIAERNR